MMDITYLTNRLVPVLKRYKIQKAILFGSIARGEASPRSDVDLILVQNTNHRFLERYDGILMEISKAVPDRDVDLLIYTPDELEKLASRRFVRQAFSEGKVIYESN
jgi:predicted nucleotidyltransferase